MLKKLLGELDLQGVLIPSGAQPSPQELPCIPRSRFSTPPGAGGRLPSNGLAKGFSEGVAQPEEVTSQDLQPVPGKAHDPFCGNGSVDQPWSLHHLDAAGKGGTAAHTRELGVHQLDSGDDRYRHQRRQAVSGAAPVLIIRHNSRCDTSLRTTPEALLQLVRDR